MWFSQMGDLLLAAEKGNLARVQHLVEENGANIEATDREGRTPLYMAAKNGHMDVVMYLVEEHAANIEATDKYLVRPQWGSHGCGPIPGGRSRGQS